jgi:hypothetical protein
VRAASLSRRLSSSSLTSLFEYFLIVFLFFIDSIFFVLVVCYAKLVNKTVKVAGMGEMSSFFPLEKG